MSKYHPDTDGLGNPIDPHAQYYIQDARQFVGNAMLWWAIEAKGYTCDIENAGVFSGEEAMKHRLSDVPWPVDLINKNVKKIVDYQSISGAKIVREAR